MKKVISLLLAFTFILAMVPLQVLAEQAGNFTYTIDSSNSTAKITKYTGNGGYITIPDSFSYNGFSYKTAAINDNAFLGCTGVISVKISDNVTVIGKSAFSGCTGLTSLDLGVGVKIIYDNAFQGCTGLVNLIIPNSVTTINANAFKDCTKLSKVVIGSGASLISNAAFSGCTGLTEFTIDDNNLFFSSQNLVLFNKQKTLLCAYLYPKIASYEIPGSVTNIDTQAFINCTQLTGVTIPISVKDIGTNAFAGCTALTGVDLPNGITEIKEKTFYGCAGLKSVVFSDSIKKIGSSAFKGCLSLTNVTIGAGVTDIGNNAFENCSGLLTLSLPEGLITIGDSSFRSCTSLSALAIPNSVSTISGSAFAVCTRLNSVVFGGGLKKIDTNAFSGCTGLTGIIIPDNVTYLGAGAFRDCKGLESATVGNGVTDILSEVFIGCILLSTLNIGSGVTTFAINAVSGCISLEELNISLNNPTFSSQDCVLFNKTKSILIHYLYSRTRSYTVPNEVNTINAKAFEDCTQLSGITIPNNVAIIQPYAFSGCKGINTVTLPQGLSILEEHTFNGCSGLTSVYIPSSVTELGNGVFEGCSGLLNVDIPNSVQIIGNDTFKGCSKMANISIPSSVMIIGNNTFSDCSSLTAVTIPDSVSTVGTYAFSSCSSLVSATLSSKMSSIPDNLFNGCSALSKIIIPDNITNIGIGCFNGCKKLAEVTISGNATIIGKEAFINCTSLSKIIIPESVSIIGEAAFSGCTSLAFVNIGNKVTTIGTNAFYNCTALTLIVIPASVFSIGATAFKNCTKLYAAYFFGDAPNMGTTGNTVFSGCAAKFTVYRLSTASGFVGFWCGYPTEIFSPVNKISITPSTTAKTNGNVNVNITYLLSAVTKQYKINNNGGWIDYPGTLAISTNCDIYAQCIDIYGTVTSEGPLHIGNIDKEAPAAPTLSASTTAPTNGSVTVTISYAADAAIRQYKIDGGNWTDYTAPIVITQNCTITAQCADDVNNISRSNQPLTINNIDKTAPAAPTFKESIETTTNTDVTLTITYAADAVVKQYNKNGSPDGPWLTYNSPITITENCTVYARCADALGNYGNVVSVNITNIDKTPPTAPSCIVSETAPTNKDVSLTITYPSETPATVNEYKIEYTENSGSWVRYSVSRVLVLTITKDCKVWAKCTDTAGNLSQTVIIIDNIDKTPPVITAVINNGTYPSGKTIIFDEGTATLDGNPFLSGSSITAAGKHTLVVTDAAGNVTTANFTIVIGVSSIALNAKTLNLTPGKTGKLTATVLPANAVNKAVSWKSSNTAAVTVDSYGNVKGIAVGKAVITCTAKDGSGIFATCTVTVMPLTPTSVKAASASYNSIKISWAAVSGATGYVVYRYNGTAYVRIASTSTLSYTNTSLTTGKYYTYYVKAYKTVNGINIESAASAAVKSKPVPAVPGSFKAARAGSTSIKVSWAAVAGASGYEVYRATSSTGTFTLARTTTSLSYTNTGLTKNKVYYYKVRAYKTVNGIKVFGSYTTIKSAKPY